MLPTTTAAHSVPRIGHAYVRVKGEFARRRRGTSCRRIAANTEREGVAGAEFSALATPMLPTAGETDWSGGVGGDRFAYNRGGKLEAVRHLQTRRTSIGVRGDHLTQGPAADRPKH